MCTPAIYFKHLFAFCSFSSHVYPCQRKPLEKKNMSFPGGLFGVLSSVPTTSVIAHHPTVNVFTSLVFNHHQTVTRRANVYMLLVARELNTVRQKATEGEREQTRARESAEERTRAREREKQRERETTRKRER